MGGANSWARELAICCLHWLDFSLKVEELVAVVRPRPTCRQGPWLPARRPNRLSQHMPFPASSKKVGKWEIWRISAGFLLNKSGKWFFAFPTLPRRDMADCC